MTGTEDESGRLERALGHRFADPGLLDEALTHSSVASAGQRRRTNERLEFLGDRVLGLVVADMLIGRFPGEDEGALARRHAALVRREALARVAVGIGLRDRIRLSRGEEDAGGRENPGLLADACEAVIAALYLDGGLDAAAAFIRDQWDAMMAEDVRPPKDAKTELQEWAQARGLALPTYREVDREGPAHAPVFSIEVSITGRPPTRASDGSKRAAEQAAAEVMLEELRRDDGRTSG